MFSEALILNTLNEAYYAQIARETGWDGMEVEMVFSDCILGKQVCVTTTNYCNSNPKYESQFGILVKASG